MGLMQMNLHKVQTILNNHTMNYWHSTKLKKEVQNNLFSNSPPWKAEFRREAERQ